MGVLRILLPASGKPLGDRPGSGFVIEPLDPGADGVAVARLIDACHAAEPGPWVPTPAGLLGDLAGPGPRRVDAWLAWPASVGAFSGRTPLGCIGLSTIRGVGAPRCSIPWLLVHPAHRRRGVATALVRRASGAAAAQAVESVSVETLTTWPAAGFWRALAARLTPDSY